MVRAILDFLNRIKELNANFSWEDAEHPEAGVIDQKVLARFADKTLFIGICTRSERAVDNAALSERWFFRDQLAGNASAFQWKASDWLIQEIGYAVGRGMRVILLLESGTRPPGALQGNHEFIPLLRDDPSKCFDALMAQIASVSPRVEALQPPSQEVETIAPASEETPDAPTSDWSHPQPDWTFEDFNRGMFFAVLEADASAERRINEAYLASNAGVSETNRRKWASSVEARKILLDRGGSLSVIKDLAEKEPQTAAIWADLAKAYRHYGERSSAIKAFEHAISCEPDAGRQIQLRGEAAVEYAKAGESGKAEELLTEMRRLADGSEDRERRILRAEVEYAEETASSQLFIAALERLLELNPTDLQRRFQLAYKYADSKMPGLAAFHYSKIPHDRRSEATWNNLGVSLSEVGLPGRSVDAYRESEKLEETLAMANLARKFMEEGFFTEAGNILDRASKIANHHKNVDTALAALKDAPDQEEKKQEEAFRKAGRVSEFYRAFGHGLAQPDSAISGDWNSPQCQLSATQNGVAVLLTGKYEVTGGLGNLISAFSAYGGASSKASYRVEYNVTVRGQTMSGRVTRTKEGDEPKPGGLLAGASLLSGEQAPEVLMVIQDDGTTISVLERSQSGDPRFYNLSRV